MYPAAISSSSVRAVPIRDAYEVADLIAQPVEEGHILLGDEIRRHTGLDDLLSRAYETWLCDTC